MQRHLLSERRQAFFGHIRATDCLPTYHLVRIIRSKDCYCVRVRAAALRNLVGKASLDVTQGRPFAERRRLVRKHYDV